jgi:hypothetical protein
VGEYLYATAVQPDWVQVVFEQDPGSGVPARGWIMRRHGDMHLVIPVPTMVYRKGEALPPMTALRVRNAPNAQAAEVKLVQEEAVVVGIEAPAATPWLRTFDPQQPLTWMLMEAAGTILLQACTATAYRLGASVPLFMTDEDATSQVATLQAGEVVFKVGSGYTGALFYHPSGKSGWIRNSNLPMLRSVNEVALSQAPQVAAAAIAQPAARPAHTDGQFFQAVSGPLTVREEPDGSSEQIATLQRGDVVEIAAAEGNWLKLALPPEVTGWVLCKNRVTVMMEQVSPTTEHVAAWETMKEEIVAAHAPPTSQTNKPAKQNQPEAAAPQQQQESPQQQQAAGKHL